jgi:hypothetical protein
MMPRLTIGSVSTKVLSSVHCEVRRRMRRFAILFVVALVSMLGTIGCGGVQEKVQEQAEKQVDQQVQEVREQAEEVVQEGSEQIEEQVQEGQNQVVEVIEEH